MQDQSGVFLPNEGSHFDDMRDEIISDEQLNSMAIRKELNERTGVAVFVGDQAQRVDMRRTLNFWTKRRELNHPVDVFVDPKVGAGKMEIRYP